LGVKGDISPALVRTRTGAQRPCGRGAGGAAARACPHLVAAGSTLSPSRVARSAMAGAC
jgi:hypothetical protein